MSETMNPRPDPRRSPAPVATTVADATPRPGPSRAVLWCILGVVLLADAVDLIDSTVTNIAAPRIVSDIGGGEALIKWLGSAYAITLGVLLVVGGRLGDLFGQRRMFLIGLSGFTLASLACGIAPDPGSIVVARAVQGAFGAMLIPQGMSIMMRTFPRDLLSKAFGLFGPLLGIAAVGGPVLAGFIVDADIAGLGWRPVFLINIVLGAIGLVAATIVLPRDRGDRSVKVDATQSALLGIAMFGLMIGLIEGSTNGWTVLPLVAIAVGVVFFGLFVQRQRTAAEPLLAPSLFTHRGFVAGLLMGLAYFAVVSGLSYVVSLFLQEGLHQSPGEASLGLLPLTIGIILASFACMGLMARLGRILVFIGLGLTCVGAGWLALLVAARGTGLGVWAMAAPVFVTGLGMGSCFGTIFDIALGDVAPAEAGSASGSLSAVQQLANGVGSAAVTTVYFRSLTGGPAHAMLTSFLVVLAITVVCFPVAALLPRAAQEDTRGV